MRLRKVQKGLDNFVINFVGIPFLNNEREYNSLQS